MKTPIFDNGKLFSERQLDILLHDNYTEVTCSRPCSAHMNTWVGYVRDDLKAHITAGRQLPAPLTLQQLSAHYAVSMTPVRGAVRQLIAEGFLYRRENGRLVVNPRRFGKPSNVEPAPSPPRNYANEIATELARLSLQGEVLFVRENETAARFGLSTTAIRQVFHELAGAGLLEHIPRRGWRLRPFRRRDLDDYVRVRELLELEALEAAWPYLEDGELERIYQGNVLPARGGERLVVDDSLHDYLIDKADNFCLRDFFHRHGRYYRTLFSWESTNHEAAVAAVEQHRAILEALLRRDRDAARSALAAHIRYCHPMLKEHLARRRKGEGDGITARSDSARRAIDKGRLARPRRLNGAAEGG
jgi:DNA-binding GntR family transcriptional regulator